LEDFQIDHQEAFMRLHLSKPTYALIAFAFAGIVVSFAPALSTIYDIWNLQPEYSYGFLIPALSAYLVWRQREQLRGLRFTGSWYGLILVGAGVALRIVGELSTMSTIERYAFLLVLYGLVLTLTGPVIFRRLWMALAVLIFMVPLPIFITSSLSLDLQLLSSVIGVWMIRAAGVSVYLQGNIVDLGEHQLEVAEACSGLRYLFPLMTLSFLIGYLFRGAFWKRAVIFVSSVPITVLMNSLRIAVVGVTVDAWGDDMARGSLHDFEGWLVFMFSLAAVMLVAYGLSKIGRSRVAWSDAFKAVPATAAPPAGPAGFQKVPRAFVAATVLIVAGAIVDLGLPERHEVIPQRADFSEFPTRVGDWVGQRRSLERVYLDALSLDDYLLADYREIQGETRSGAQGPPINFYVAYYQSQRSAHRVHSPINCIPGGGWTIRTLERRLIPAGPADQQVAVNRAIIELGQQRQLVYYWFRERGRNLTDENLVKWYLFWDAFTRHRTDGALVRMVIPMSANDREADLDARMQRFLALAVPPLNRYVPN
jgi:exosortase D (VPLPA-CTERM-specific)